MVPPPPPLSRNGIGDDGLALSFFVEQLCFFGGSVGLFFPASQPGQFLSLLAPSCYDFPPGGRRSDGFHPKKRRKRKRVAEMPNRIFTFLGKVRKTFAFRVSSKNGILNLGKGGGGGGSENARKE